jgi:hypothetical protein
MRKAEVSGAPMFKPALEQPLPNTTSVSETSKIFGGRKSVFVVRECASIAVPEWTVLETFRAMPEELENGSGRARDCA